MWPVSEFEVQVWRDGHEPLRCYSTRSTDDIVAQLTTAGGPLFLQVAAVLRQGGEAQDLSLGVMLLWLNADGMAWVRLGEHRDHDLSDPARVGLTGDVDGFLDDTERPFAVPAANVITVGQAASVLDYWLDCGGRLPGLTWS